MDGMKSGMALVIAWLIAIGTALVSGYFFGRRFAPLVLTAGERREFIHDIVSHFLAFCVLVGFFGAIFIPLLGVVDIKDPTTTGFMGVVLGYVSTKFEPVVAKYFGRTRSPEAPAPARKTDDRPAP